MAYSWREGNQVALKCNECKESNRGDRDTLREKGWCWGAVRISGDEKKFALCPDHKDKSSKYFDKLSEELR